MATDTDALNAVVAEARSWRTVVGSAIKAALWFLLTAAIVWGFGASPETACRVAIGVTGVGLGSAALLMVVVLVVVSTIARAFRDQDERFAEIRKAETDRIDARVSIEVRRLFEERRRVIDAQLANRGGVQ